MAMHCTVLIPAYNTDRYIARSIASALRQPDSDVLVVDDGSTDGTFRLVSSLATTEERISIVRFQTNEGVTKATDVGIRMARGPIVTILDSDDEMLPGAFIRTIPKFEADPGLGFVWSRFVLTSGREGWSGHLPHGLCLYEAMMYKNWWRAAHHKFIRKEMYLKSIGLDTNIKAASDYQLALVMAATGCGTRHVPEVTYRYTERRPGSITSKGRDKQKIAAAQARVYVARKVRVWQ